MIVVNTIKNKDNVWRQRANWAYTAIGKVLECEPFICSDQEQVVSKEQKPHISGGRKKSAKERRALKRIKRRMEFRTQKQNRT